MSANGRIREARRERASIGRTITALAVHHQRWPYRRQRAYLRALELVILQLQHRETELTERIKARDPLLQVTL